jgi:hypothetical protein
MNQHTREAINKRSFKILEVYCSCLKQLSEGVIPKDFDCYASLFQQDLSNYNTEKRKVLVKVLNVGIEQKKYLLAQQKINDLKKGIDFRLTIINDFLKSQ